MPCSDEPADITHVCINCVNAFALTARSSCSVHLIVNGLTLSSLHAKGRLFLTPRAVRLLFVNPGVTFAQVVGMGHHLHFHRLCFVTFGSKVQSSSLVSIKVQLFKMLPLANTSNMRTAPGSIFFPNISYSATQEFFNLGSP